MVLAALAGNPSTLWMTVGIPGTVIRWILTQLFSGVASAGLVLMNVGAMKVESVLDKAAWDGSIESAMKILEDIRTQHRDVTPEEAKKIDDEVIKALRKFGRFGRPR